MEPNIIDIYLDSKRRRHSLKTPDVLSVSGEDRSADVMNDGFHEGWEDSGHGLEEPSTSRKMCQKKPDKTVRLIVFLF